MTGYYSPKPIHVECQSGGNVRNIVFSNISINAANYGNSSVIKGLNPTNTVDSVTFGNVKINNVLIQTEASAPLTVRPFAYNVTVQSPALSLQPDILQLHYKAQKASTVLSATRVTSPLENSSFH